MCLLRSPERTAESDEPEIGSFIGTTYISKHHQFGRSSEKMDFAGKTGTVPGTPGVDKAMDIKK